MSDRDALLATIVANPRDDVARLIYAEHLDEYPQSDLDTATAEFIRLSCTMDSAKDKQNVKEGAWLEKNWKRLVPSLAAMGFQKFQRRGRKLQTWCDLPMAGNRTWRSWCILNCWRGFVDEAVTYRPVEVGVVRAVGRDQPLATLCIENAIYDYSDFSGVTHSSLGVLNASASSYPLKLLRDIFYAIEGADRVYPDHERAVIVSKDFLATRGDPLAHRKRVRAALSAAIRTTLLDATPATG